jgi:hypothetical protein
MASEDEKMSEQGTARRGLRTMRLLSVYDTNK